MTVAPKACADCGIEFLGRSSAAYCSPACRQRAHRSRSGGNRNGSRNAKAPASVTVTDGSDRAAADVVGSDGGTGGHSSEALAVLAGLDAELAENGRELGDTLHWSTAELALRELIADTIDRRTDLQRLYAATDDGKLMVKLSAEMRLLEGSLARLLKQVNTDLPEPMSMQSMKAQQAARTRWSRNA